MSPSMFPSVDTTRLFPHRMFVSPYSLQLQYLFSQHYDVMQQYNMKTWMTSNCAYCRSQLSWNNFPALFRMGGCMYRHNAKVLGNGIGVIIVPKHAIYVKNESFQICTVPK